MNYPAEKNKSTSQDSLILKKVEAAMLLDAYGALLTERQRQGLSLFYEEDLSLSEIGEAFAISRQAVHDAIRHGEAQLHEYEAALHLVAKENQRQQIIHQLQQLIGDQHEAVKLLQQLL